MNDKSYDLIVTKIFKNLNDDVLLLGNWCVPNDNKTLDNIPKYHWENKN